MNDDQIEALVTKALAVGPHDTPFASDPLAKVKRRQQRRRRLVPVTVAAATTVAIAALAYVYVGRETADQLRPEPEPTGTVTSPALRPEAILQSLLNLRGQALCNARRPTMDIDAVVTELYYSLDSFYAATDHLMLERIRDGHAEPDCRRPLLDQATLVEPRGRPPRDHMVIQYELRGVTAPGTRVVRLERRDDRWVVSDNRMASTRAEVSLWQ